jgi:hypothetical protein
MITVSRSGGVAGATRRWHVDVESDVTEWRAVVDACPWSQVDDVDADGRPDRFIYVIVADSRRATLPESRVTGPWRELIDRVRQQADSPEKKS